MKSIRNFTIIAHVDHGKSTLADRFLEITGTVSERRMHAQYLDQLELERERGITIKMAPVRMSYTLNTQPYILNLIDTPGHSDFSYEVSRALQAVEGAILLVDATQGIQAQTIANFYAAREAGLSVLGAVNKIDLFKNDTERLRVIAGELADFISVSPEEIFLVSGKTGEGAAQLLEGVIRRVPPPRTLPLPPRAFVFDSFYDNHKGVVASVRVFGGPLRTDHKMTLAATGNTLKVKEVGYFTPELVKTEAILEGEIGYVATGLRDPEAMQIGDTMVEIEETTEDLSRLSLPGYREPIPVVFVSVYPADANEYDLLKRSLQKLHLNDAALSIAPDQNAVLGRGFKLGFLGKLHFEIVAERIRREFGVELITTFPSVRYRVKRKGVWIDVIKAEDAPDDYDEIWEPMIEVRVLVPEQQVKEVFAMQKKFRMRELVTEMRGTRIEIRLRMPLAELVSDFDDYLKSVTGGLASFSYTLSGYEKTDVVRVDAVLSGETVPGLSRFFSRETFEHEARMMVQRLKELLPREQFHQPVQAKAEGKIVAREDIPAIRKDVTGYLYGGDRTRKMKLWQKQKRGKARLKERARTHITPEVFKELLKK